MGCLGIVLTAAWLWALVACIVHGSWIGVAILVGIMAVNVLLNLGERSMRP